MAGNSSNCPCINSSSAKWNFERVVDDILQFRLLGDIDEIASEVFEPALGNLARYCCGLKHEEVSGILDKAMQCSAILYTTGWQQEFAELIDRLVERKLIVSKPQAIIMIREFLINNMPAKDDWRVGVTQCEHGCHAVVVTSKKGRELLQKEGMDLPDEQFALMAN